MEFLVAVAVVFYVGNIILDEMKTGKKKSKKQRPEMYVTNHYEFGGLVTKPFMTKTENLFLDRLDAAFEDYAVFAQVQLTSFILPPKGDNYQATLNRYNRQSVDYVICDDEMNVIAGIELDDKSHVGRDSRERDAKKDDVFREAGIPLFRWHAEKMPPPTAIRREFNARLFPELNN